ncbi:MAG: thioredoxin family protein [Pirellulaceae bacterium]
MTQNYAAAYRDASQHHKPLLVVVGAEWCPACVNLKSTTIKSLAAKGQLDNVSLAVVDQDAEPELAAQLKRGKMIPQVILFSQTPDGVWQKTHLTGFQSEGALKSVIDSACKKSGSRSTVDAT